MEHRNVASAIAWLGIPCNFRKKAAALPIAARRQRSHGGHREAAAGGKRASVTLIAKASNFDFEIQFSTLQQVKPFGFLLGDEFTENMSSVLFALLHIFL